MRQIASEGSQLRRGSRGYIILSLFLEQAHLTGQSIRAAVLQGRHLCGVLPVTHPTDHGATAIGSVTPAYGRVMILSKVHPLGRHVACGIHINLESLSIEITYEILRSTTAKRSTRVDVADQHPFLHVRVRYRQLKQIRAFPYAILRTQPFTERTLQGPLLQIGRGEDQHLMLQGMSQYQGPQFRLVVPPHVRVSRLTLERQHRVTLVRAEFVSAVGAVSEALDLAGRRGGIKCHDRILAEARAIGHIHRRATTEDRAQSVGQQGRLVMLPVD